MHVVCTYAYHYFFIFSASSVKTQKNVRNLQTQYVKEKTLRVSVAMSPCRVYLAWYAIYLDDIHVTGESKSARLRNLEEVLMRLKEHVIRLKTEKCHFFRKSV